MKEPSSTVDLCRAFYKLVGTLIFVVLIITTRQESSVIFASTSALLSTGQANSPLFVLPEFKLPYDRNLNVYWTGGPHAYGEGGNLEDTYDTGTGSGLDFSNHENFEVLAMAAGTVIDASCDDKRPLGCQIAIRHDEGGTVLIYAHLREKSFRVAPKAHVPQGFIIAEAGATGTDALGNTHLHIDLRDGSSNCAWIEHCLPDNLGGNPIGWEDGLPLVDGYYIHGYLRELDDPFQSFNYDGSAVKGGGFGEMRPFLDFPSGVRKWAIIWADPTFECDAEKAETCEDNNQNELTQFAGNGSFSIPDELSGLATVHEDGDTAGRLVSTNVRNENFAIFLPVIGARTEPHEEWIAYLDWDFDANIWLISTDAQRRVQVTDDAAPYPDSISYFWHRWSPNGQKLAFIRRQFLEESIYVYDLATGTTQALVIDENIKGFTWTPDSTAIVYAPQAGDLGLYLVELSTGQSHQYLTAPGDEPLVWPTFSPDGRYLAFEELNWPEGPFLVVYDAIYKKYPPPYKIWRKISWSPDSESFAFAYSEDSGIDNLPISLKTPAFMGQSIALTSGHHDSNPQFSPNGDLVAFIRATISNIHGSFGPVWLVDPDPHDGIPTYQLANITTAYLRWSPDGRRLVVQKVCDLQFLNQCADALIILDLDLSGAFVLLEGGKWPEWQP